MAQATSRYDNGTTPTGGLTSAWGTKGGVIRIHAAGEFCRGHRERGLTRAKVPIATVQQGATKEGKEKTRYTDDDIAAIMGFSHVT